MMKKTKILAIDDELAIRVSLRAILTAKGFDVTLAASGAEGLSLAVDIQPDLVLLDLNMPEMNGLQVCQSLRDWFRGLIIVVSANEGEADKIAALKMGADDYVTKPFSIGELLARIEAHVRRVTTLAAASLSPLIHAGALSIDISRHQVWLEGDEIKLTPIEYDILVMLARHVNCVVTQRMLLQQIWGDAEFGDSRILRVHVSNLRKKIETESARRYIVTEHGIGLRLVVE